MVYKNAFFQMLIKDAVYIKYFPPREGGEKLNLDELASYLSSHSIEMDYKEFSKAVQEAKEPLIFKTNTEKTYPEAEKMIVNISDDGMQAICRFIPPSTGGRIMHKEDLLKDLEFNGVKFGIIESAVDSYINNKQYCTDYIMARGKAPINGHDAQIIYKFNTDLQAKPKEKEDGSVDFFDLDIIASVEAGDELAELMLMDGKKPVSTMKGFAELATIKDPAGDFVQDMHAVFSDVLADFETLHASARLLKEKADDENDTLVSAKMDGFLEDYAKILWMLRSTLA